MRLVHLSSSSFCTPSTGVQQPGHMGLFCYPADRPNFWANVLSGKQYEITFEYEGDIMFSPDASVGLDKEVCHVHTSNLPTWADPVANDEGYYEDDQAELIISLEDMSKIRIISIRRIECKEHSWI